MEHELSQSEQERQELQSQLMDTKVIIEELNQEKSTLESQQAILQSELQTWSNATEVHHRELDDWKTKLIQSEHDLELAQQRIAELDSHLDVLKSTNGASVDEQQQHLEEVPFNGFARSRILFSCEQNLPLPRNRPSKLLQKFRAWRN